MFEKITYPVAIVASVLMICFAAVLVVALLKGQTIQAVLGAVGALASVLGGLFAHRAVTPLARPRAADGTPLVRGSVPRRHY